MFNKQLFILAHTLFEPSFYKTYKFLVKNQWRPYAELIADQEKQLRYMISFAYDNVPYYHKLFKELMLKPGDIRTIEDLQKLPILTKDIIKQHWEDFKPLNLSSMKYDNQATGGSTGTPLQYRLLQRDRFLSGALLYRGWGYGSYELGDRIIFLGGSSIGGGASSILEQKAHEITRNLRKLSSYDMGEVEMERYTGLINNFKPKFLRGYASSIYFYAQWLKEKDIPVLPLNAIFTTAEKLHPHMRDSISKVFDCEVFDGYGLNDGGVGAYECPEHSGLHIDTERSIMEVVDPGGYQLDEGHGQIIATSLHNYAIPFIRYDTGDIGNITQEKCNCGRKNLLLSEILGREYEILYTPEGQGVFGGFFTTKIFYQMDSVKEFQVIQKEINKLIVNIVPENSFQDDDLNFIKAVIRSKSKKWEVEVNFVDTIDRSKAGKYKFVINEMENNTCPLW